MDDLDPVRPGGDPGGSDASAVISSSIAVVTASIISDRARVLAEGLAGVAGKQAVRRESDWMLTGSVTECLATAPPKG